MSRKWEPCKPLPDKRCYTACIPYKGPIPMLKNQIQEVIFVIGGCDVMGIPVNTLYMYLPEKNFWFPLKSMEVKRANPICSILNERYIIALGGVGNDPPQAPVSAIEIYDINLNYWHQMPSMTKPLMGMAALYKNNNLLIFGGMENDTNPTDDSRIVSLSIEGDDETATDPSKKKLTLSWNSLPKMKTARYVATALDFEERVAVLGGRVGKNPVNSFEVYHKNSAIWENYPDFPMKTVFKVRGLFFFIYLRNNFTSHIEQHTGQTFPRHGQIIT